MTTTAQLRTQVYQRLEENPAFPVFWQDYEVYAAIQEAMCEASLITGVVQVNPPALFTLPPNTNFVNLPADGVALLRMEGAGSPVQKTEMFSLDQIMPGWENVGGASASPAVITVSNWFPFGLNQFGIYPQLTIPQQVSITYLAYPAATAVLNGTEAVPFQEEFTESLTQYAAHVLRLKEMGQEFELSQVIYQEFLSTMRRLSQFMLRQDSLIFARSAGVAVRVNPVEVR